MMLKFLLGNTETAPIGAKYLRKTMELRIFLIYRPKQLKTGGGGTRLAS